MVLMKYLFVPVNHPQKHDNYEKRLKSERLTKLMKNLVKECLVFSISCFSFQGA